MSENLNFKISSALKNIIGKELINDKFIAVFELVKNSYDAGATRVDISFNNIFDINRTSITIEDNGCGMNYEDIKNKWLFVAYSEKKIRNQTSDYRERIKRVAAGAKGVGRFSCDRLGASLDLYTNTVYCNKTNVLKINWDNFEQDDKNEFINVDVKYDTVEPIMKCGTKIILSNLREIWTKDNIIQLKNALKRLINPDNETHDSFDIYLHVKELTDNEINGRIFNDIFEKLNIKTTSVELDISEDGKQIKTALYDRGRYIYSVKEKNEFDNLFSIKIKLFYLNRSAKSEFTKSMGIESVNYGSVFIYKNNFRIFPYGEPGKDFFDMDRRKTQGYNRYLGTREVIGRISITCDDKHFIETSSRNSGFLESKGYNQLIDCFYNKVLKFLEKYVVDVIEWGDLSKEDILAGKTKALNPEDVKLEIINQLASISKRKDIIDIDYNTDLLNVIQEASADNVESKLNRLKDIAQKSKDKNFQVLANNVIGTTKALYKENQENSKTIQKISDKNEKLQNQYESERNKSFFMEDALSIEQKNFIEKMHTVNINIDTIKKNICLLYDDVKNGSASKEDIENTLKDISFLVERIRSLTQYGGVANFNLNDEFITQKLGEFIDEYCEKIFRNRNIDIAITNHSNISLRFCPQNISTLLENLISNSIKAKAKKCWFEIQDKASFVVMDYFDDGVGLKKNVDLELVCIT